ncbi:MAG: HAMP domain-containing histidine kinase [Actinobacteria bacterium]|nr:MAG: HAMP domain-containing histidine kinase [Actinomycetota bacterium]
MTHRATGLAPTELKVDAWSAEDSSVDLDNRDRRALPLEAFLSGRPPAYVLAVAVLFVIGVGVADSLIGPNISIAPFYVLPILIATWNLGRAWGFLVAGLAAVAMQLAHVRSVETNVLVPSWNALVWYAVFLFVVWLLAIIRDHAKRQRTQLESQEEVSDDLRAQNDMKNTLLHAVSHDLKGPLAGILGAMQTIRRADQLRLTGVELNDLYGVIEQAGKKAARLVDDLLDLDRLRRGQLQPEREPTDVGELADRVALELPSLSGHPIRIESEPMLVDVDRAKVERIVENLLNNAARHTPAGTPVQVLITEQGHGVVVVVEDEGPGVSDDIKDEIFEPFRQGASARGGVGIGLSLVQRFAELHGGTASVEDRPGGGARFVVTLPGEVQHVTRPAPLRAV